MRHHLAIVNGPRAPNGKEVSRPRAWPLETIRSGSRPALCRVASAPTLGSGPALVPSSVRASPCPRRCLFRAGQGPALSPCPWEAGRGQRNWSPRPPCPLHHLGGGFRGVCGPWWGSPWADGGGCVPGSVPPLLQGDLGLDVSCVTVTCLSGPSSGLARVSRGFSLGQDG